MNPNAGERRADRTTPRVGFEAGFARGQIRGGLRYRASCGQIVFQIEFPSIHSTRTLPRLNLQGS